MNMVIRIYQYMHCTCMVYLVYQICLPYLILYLHLSSSLSSLLSKAVQAMQYLISSLSDGSYVLVGGVLDPNAFHVCLLALIMDVSTDHKLMSFTCTCNYTFMYMYYLHLYLCCCVC